MTIKKYAVDGVIVRRSERKYTHAVISRDKDRKPRLHHACGSYELAIKARNTHDRKDLEIVPLEVVN